MKGVITHERLRSCKTKTWDEGDQRSLKEVDMAITREVH